MGFASDTTAPVAPEILAAILAANEGYARSYGDDALTSRVRDRIREVFEAPEAAVFLVPSGTAANALSLALLSDPWSAIYCHGDSHIAADECGAPEFFTGGAKLVPIAGEQGKMRPEALDAALANAGRGDVHHVVPGVLSITNVTERGTLYSVDEVARLAGIAKAEHLAVHMDGARFANSVVAAGCSPAEMTWKAGVDVLSFGASKNGCMGVEAVVIFDPRKSWEFELRRKRGGHLVAKYRFLAAQFDAYLRDGLWLELARRSNAAGVRLSAGLADVPGAELLAPADANLVFAALPRAAHLRALADDPAYHGPARRGGPADEALAVRLVCSWCTTAEDVDHFLSVIRGRD